MIYDVHINELNKKAMGILMYISRISDKLDRQNRIIIIETLVLSLRDYCIKIWGTTNDKQMSNVQKLQNFSSRVAFGGVRKYGHIAPVFRELQWLRIKQKYLFDFTVTVYKVLKRFYPDWFLSFKSRRAITNGITRQTQQLYVPRTNTHTGDRCIDVLGPTLWNTLPPTVTQAPTLSTFKAKLKKFLLLEIM